MEEIQAAGCNGAPCAADVHDGHGAAARQRGPENRFLPEDRERRIAAAGVRRDRADPPGHRYAGATHQRGARRHDDDSYVINELKILDLACAEHSTLMLLLARTTPLDQIEAHRGALSVFIVDMHAGGNALKIGDPHDDGSPRRRSLLRRCACPEAREPGRRGRPGLPLHPLRHECRAHSHRRRVHRRRQFIEKASACAKERNVFGRPIGRDQGIQFPIARAYALVRAAS